METNNARLVLEDGAIFRGRSWGAAGRQCGEVVFCTAMTGYQEALTDPSYRGQILVLTAAHIGNYGVCSDDVESECPQVAGFVVHESAAIRSNCRSDGSLPGWLQAHGIPAIDGIDTRALVRRLRSGGAMRGVLAVDDAGTDAELLEMVRSSPRMDGQDLASEAGTGAGGGFDETLDEYWPAAEGHDGPPLKVVAIDCGAKRNIYRHLTAAGCDVHIVPPPTSAQAIRAMHPDGLFISNGPGDPAAVTTVIETLREVAGEVPTFGICLGHQLLALSLGATTWKLPFGHRGANQPVRDVEADRIAITSQNHGCCVDADSLEAAGCIVTHWHLNDDTVAGFRHATKPIMGVQFHPEASPGPHEAASLFGQFVMAMLQPRPKTVAGDRAAN